MKQDKTRVYYAYLPKMNIIGETPPIYANIDPSFFYNIQDHPEITKNEVEILELDIIYIDQLGSMLQALNMNIIEMRWELATTKNPNVTLSNPINFEDSLFVYIGSLRWLLPTFEIYDAGNVHDCKCNNARIE